MVNTLSATVVQLPSGKQIRYRVGTDLGDIDYDVESHVNELKRQVRAINRQAALELSNSNGNLRLQETIKELKSDALAELQKGNQIIHEAIEACQTDIDPRAYVLPFIMLTDAIEFSVVCKSISTILKIYTNNKSFWGIIFYHIK